MDIRPPPSSPFPPGQAEEEEGDTPRFAKGFLLIPLNIKHLWFF